MSDLETQLDDLAALVGRLETPFVWSAAVTTAQPITLCFGDGAKIALASPTRLGREEALAALVARAKAAPFGAGNKTKLDARVRDGLAIRADAGVSLAGFDPNANGVLDQVHLALAPDDPAPLHAELYAVNLYRAGGHFKAHKDTPRGEGMLGTLVVCLPWRFEGGELEIVNGQRRVVLDWSKELARDSSSLPCAAFFGDVDHSVGEVTSGTRVTVSFVVRRAASSAKRAKRTKAEATKGAEPHQELARRLAEIAADPEVGKEGLALRFPCTHQYAVTPETPAVLPITSDEGTHSLKGRDALVARAALAAGLDVSLAYVLWVHDEDGIALDARLEEPPTPKKLAKLQRLLGRTTSEEGGISEDDLSSEIGASDELPSRVVGYDSAGATHLGSGGYSPTGYYGNEASEADYYVGAAIDVVIPKRGVLPERRTVMHRKWGAGVVVAVTTENGERKLRVRFDSGEEKTLLERFVTMT